MLLNMMVGLGLLTRDQLATTNSSLSTMKTLKKSAGMSRPKTMSNQYEPPRCRSCALTGTLSAATCPGILA